MSLNLAEAWKGIAPPSPSDTVEKKAAVPATPITTRRSPSPEAVPPALPDSSLQGIRPSFLLSPESSGLLEPGNIDLSRRQVVREADGRSSAVRPISIGQNGREYLIPTVSDDGRLLSDHDAINLFKQTGRHLGAFKTMQDANEYADKLHRWQETMYAANPQDFQGPEVRKDSPLVSAFPGQAATPLSPAPARSLFDLPLISSSSPSTPAYKPDPKRMEELHALILHGKEDPELDALLDRNPAFRAQATLDDRSMPSRAAMGEQIIREILGQTYASEPGFYFLSLGEKLPESATRQEAYAAVHDHYAQAVEKQYEQNKARRTAYQKNRAEVEQAVSHVVGGVWSPGDLNEKLTPEQLSVYRQEFDTEAIEKAHAAFSLLKQTFSATPEEGLRRMVSERTAMKITSALSEDDGTGKLTINETAFGLFEGSLHSLMEAVKEQSGDEWKFMHNMRVALFNPATKRDASLGTGLQLSGQQQILVPFAKDHNAQVFGLMEQTVQDYEAYVKNDHENARVLGLLSTGQDLGNQANDRASFASRTVNCLGSIVGQTAPFFIPYAGWGLALAGACDDKRNRAYYDGLQPGTAEWSAFVDAAASVAVEKISYGGLGRLSGAGWVMGKLPFMNKARQALTDSLWKKILFESGAGVVEETLVEPTAEAIIQWAVRNNIAPLAGVDVGGNYDWNNYWNELKGMLEPDQLLATALFVGGVAGTQSAIARRSLITHSRSPEMLRMQGIPENEANRISRIEDNKERIAAVRESVNKLKTLPPEDVLQNAKEGVKAFHSLAEVRATVESEAYKFFQQEMRLPLVEERADKPGMYDVTVFDSYSGQKKFTQEMTEGQLVSLFGDYFRQEERKYIAGAQSAFAANAFLRSAEEKKAVQAQDMLRWGMETKEKTGDDKSAGEAGDVRKEAGKGTEERKSEHRETNGPGRNENTGEAGEGKKTDQPPSSEKADSIDSSTSGTEDVSVLGRFIRSVGSMSQQGFSYLARGALNEWNRRLASGMSQAEAGAAPFPALSPFAPLRSLLHLDKEFAKRMEIASRTSGEEDANQTLLFQMKTAPGTTPADFLFLVSRGLVGSREMLEDLFEVGIKHFLKGNAARLQALGELLRETQAGLNKLGFRGEFISPAGPLDEMKVVEAMSKLALSDMLANAASLPLPEWQKDLLQYHVNFLQDAAYLLNLGRAYNMGREKGTITQELADTLRDLGHQVHTIFDQARIEQQDIQAVMEARAIVDSRRTPGASSGAPTASQIREKQKRDSEEEKRHVSTADRSKERTIPKEALQHPESVTLPEAPESMQGVFVNGASYNPDAGTWIGMVPVEKLHLSPEVPQVKVNAGKKGVVNPLVGEYRADAPPVYVWKRKDGRLEVVSGRHRLDLAQRTGTRAIAAYVYEEDFTHNAQWARLLDYEQNMQDDQADELTAAIYVRETSLTDDELTRRGLTRSGTKSRRGLLIGREAREDLWTRFRSGAIKAQDAEVICLLTQHIQDKDRIDAMQMSAANDLSNGKSLEFVAAKIQLMAHAQADGGMVQGLISFGESFEADMEKAAEFVSRCIGTINEHINAIKGVRNISRKGNVLETEGITAGLSEDPAERLKELQLLKAMYEKIGLYENLRIRALTWDGKTPPDPIGDHRLDMQAERARAAEEAAAHEDEENRKAAAELTATLSFSLTPTVAAAPLGTMAPPPSHRKSLGQSPTNSPNHTSSLVNRTSPLSAPHYFPALWREAEKELNDKGNVSFSLNGSRVAIYTFPEREIRKSLEMGRMAKTGDMNSAGETVGPENRREAIPFGSVPAGKIACILHPESLPPDARSASKPDAADSGKQLPLSDFSGFILPSSLEESLYPALQEIGVPVRVYHVTEEDAAFLEDPRSMGKDEVEKNDPRRKGLQDRRNNLVRSFLEENDVSFSLSAEERRITATARREDTWMRAPDGTPTALTERQWLQVHSEAFKKWFGESKIVNEHGEPVVVYHGTARADRVGTVFRGDRATSGPMAFFTDDEKIASNYAKDKRDTSIGYEEEDYYDYHQQFRVTLPSGRDISLERYWHHLSLAEQRRITTLAGHIREDWDGDNSIIVDPSTNDANGGFSYHLQEARGNAFRALVYHWLESGTLFNEEHRFLEILAKLDLPLSPRYRDPDYQEPKVYACFMRMENPFRTARITKKIVASLKTASKKAEVARESWRTDLWDKNNVVPEDWIERLENDYENKTTHAWTAIPDWVTECLRKKGYDGIIDQGGKFHADDHTVCIPFDSIQIKSATDNRGTFDPGTPDITFSLSNLAAVHSLEAEKLAAADQLGGLPLPSLAVTRLDRPYTWGGDENIYLVGSPALADPARGVEIHDRDMWSGHFPELRWNRREEKEREEFYRKAEEAALRYYDGTNGSTLRFLKNALDGDHRGALENKLRHSDLSLAVFAGERGYSPHPLMQKVSGRLHTGDKLFHREVLKMLPWKDATLLSPARQEEFCAAMERAIERYRNQFDQDSGNENLTVSQSLIRKGNLREMEKELKEAREDHFEAISVLALTDARQSGKTVLDWQANFKRFERYAGEHKKAFNAWVQDKMDRWLNPVPRIKENGFPATLDNITRYMLGSKGNGQEQGGIFSTGLLRAKRSRQFRSLDQIKENRDILVTSDEYELSQEEAQGLIHKFQEVLYGIVQDFSAFNKAVEALSLVEGKPTPSKILSALSRLYRGTSYRSRMAGNSYLLGLGVAALHAMKSELRDYYEAIPQRAVLLKEFSHAVLPASMKKNKQVRDILRRHGIRPLYHDGTLEGRTCAMSSLIGSAVSFSLSSGPSWLQFPTSDFMASLSEEERAISEKALASGGWLKAPNGQTSRLTPRQWVQVRTEAFKNWFGDWEHNPLNSSRVMDTNGEPLVVYHGTRRAGFTVFDNRKGTRPLDIPEGSSFFTTDPEIAASYSGTQEKANLRPPLADTLTPGIYPCFLNLRTPLEEDFGGLWWYEKGDPWFDLYDNQSDSYISPPDEGEYWTSEQAGIDYAAARGLTDYMLIRISSSRTVHTVMQEAIGIGADGAVIYNVIDPGDDTGNKETDVYVSLSPEQIKSATENIGTFDSSSPDITFSVIGPRADTWKQYKKKVFTGRDDGMPRAEINTTLAVLKDHDAPYRDSLLRELAAQRDALPEKTKKRLARYLTLHRLLFKNNKTLPRDGHAAQWEEFLALDDDRREWSAPLLSAILRTGLYRNRLQAAALMAESTFALELLNREDPKGVASLASLGVLNTSLPLKEWLDYPELFAAYPQLQDIPIVQDYLPGLYGQYSPAEGTIYLNRNLESEQQVRSVLLHEVQHAIQHIEGFAKGGNESSAKRFYEERRKDARTAYRQAEEFMNWLNARDGMISTLEYMLSLARHPRRVLRTSYRYSYDGITLRLEGEERILDMARYALKELSGQLERYYDASWNNNPAFDLPWPGNYALNTPSGIRECLKDARATPSRRLAYRKTPKPDLVVLYRNWLKYEKLSQLSSHQLYSRLAGEIEARNVQHREDWPEERRVSEPFNDTLEFPGETLISFSLTPGDSPANIPNRTSFLVPRTSPIVPRTSEGTAFSLSSLRQIVSSLSAPSLQTTRAAELVKDFDRAAENWRRVMSSKEEKLSARVGAELFGTINSLISAARLVLPKGYRTRINLQMQWASVYAAMAETGQIPPKGTLQTGDIFYKNFEESVINDTTTATTPEEIRQTIAALGSQRLDRTMSRILDRVRDQLVYFAKDQLLEKTMKRVEAAYPKKEQGKKSPRGRLEAQAYRNLAQYRFMLAADSETKEEVMTALEAKYREEEEVEKQQEQEKDLLAWKTFGDYKGMSLVQAQNAMEKLLEFVLSGRNVWDRKLDRERGRTKFTAREIQKNLPAVNSATSRAGAKIEHRSRLKKFLKSVPFGFMSYSHLMLALEPILGQRFTRARMQEIADANAALLNASNDRSAWLYDTICRIAGLKSESAAEQWLVKFNKPEKTKIPMNPVIKIKVSLPIDEAKEWFSLSKEERNARRAEIRENDRRMEIISENVPEEEDISLLREALEEYEKRSPEEQDRQEMLKSVRDIPNPDGSGPLVCSRDCALYAILLHEQPDYADVYDEEGKLVRQGFLHREGLDDKGITALYGFVGTEGLGYGYALRKRLQETGLTLAQVYEERMGVPFTLKENYFRATFDRNSTREKDALTEPKTGSIGGGKYGLLIDRILHSENLDFSKAASLVFLAAAAEQDNYIYTSHITTAWRALLKNKILEQKLKQNLGEDMMGKLSSWMDLIDGASLENNRAFLNLSRMQGMLQRAFAISVLAGNGYVLLKQSTAILHGFFAGWVPSAVLERAEGTREMVHRHISFSDFLFHLAGAKLGLGDISLKDLKESPWFKARMRDKGAMLAQIANLMPGQRYSPLEKLAEKSMDIIEWVDVKANLHSMHALANAYYAKAKELNEMNEFPFTDAQLRQAALQQVGLSLELGAQPLTKTQKSMNQAAGGILSKLTFIMKSEQLNKLGLITAEWKTGSARNRVCAVQSWLALGVTSSMLAWLIAWIKGMDDDDDEKKWRKYGTTALLGDLTTIPLAGEAVNYLASLITGERVFADSYARTLVDVGGITRAAKKEYEHLSEEKEMDWDAHFNNLTALVRAAGVGGAFSRSSSAVVSSYGALSLSAATGANISRTAKDLLSVIFRDEEEERKKKQHKKKPKKTSDQ